ncbi:DUF3631 domain-containing protein [Microbulbifer mangrovi]|uniref:DUF3631 domain-containing protein n=1 Tax=Microbulbifer mangrovi TaxID=927787 RepID=UPI0009906B46|nr:DUF3631 domain-containing protein [Microbulbifer mangrovi]
MKDEKTGPRQGRSKMAKQPSRDTEATVVQGSAKEETSRASDELELKRLAALNKLDYGRQRKDASTKLGVTVNILDRLVNDRRASQIREPDAESWEVSDGIRPWHKSVEGHTIATEIQQQFDRFCILPDSGSIALTLWTIGTYCYDGFSIFPKLLLSSPVKRCGKSTVMELLSSMAHRALPTSNVSAAAIFRMIQEWSPALLIDEADTFLNKKDNSDMVGIINSGHRKSMAFVIRVGGDDYKPQRFSTWSPMAIAMISEPPDTIRDRSITLTLRRKLATEKVQKVPVNINRNNHSLRQQCQRWARDHQRKLGMAEPDVPAVGNDRAEDNWIPLLAIADTIGGDWPNLARLAMSRLEDSPRENQDYSTMLLTDLRSIFLSTSRDNLWTTELLGALIAMEDRPWGEWRNGRPISPHGLAKLLQPFGVKSQQLKKGYENRRGFSRGAFQDAFLRYLPEEVPESATPLPTPSSKGTEVAEP